MTGTVLRVYEQSAATAWDAFVAAHPDASFCHRAGWAQILEGLTGYSPRFCYAERDGQVVGILPLAVVRRPLGGRAVVSTPFCSYGGVVAEDRDTAAMLEQEAIRIGVDVAAAYVELRGATRDESAWIESSANATFTRALPADPDAVITSIPRKQRAEVRKAEAAGLQVDSHRDVGRFFRLYAQSLRNLGSPVGPLEYYERLLTVFGADCSILSVHHEGRDLTTVLNLHHRGSVMPYHGGGLPAARRVAAFPYMYWWLMRDAVESRGATLFDFGRSPLESSAAAFKRNFGFAPQPLIYAHRMIGGKHPPAGSAEPSAGYRAAIAVWKRLPLPLANRLGPWALRAVV